MGSSECSRNHFISEIYKTVQLFKLHFLQDSPLVQTCTSVSYCKEVGNIPGSHFVKAFSLFHRNLDGASNITKRRPFSVDLS